MTNKEPLKIFIGYDPREAVVYHTCVQSIIENTKSPVSIHPLHLDMFEDYKEEHKDGSNAFIYSRFLVPYLSNFRGKALFVDGDMIVNKDLNELFNLFDKTEYPDKLYFGFEEKAAFYNDLDLAKNVLVDYGIAQKNINVIDAKKKNLENLSDIDIVISSIAWGFHFPVSVYINEVVRLMNHESILILDIRKDTNGLEELNNFFHCKKVLEGKKSFRLVCSKR